MWTSVQISIHALRVEGDMQGAVTPVALIIFLSTPSGWRATSVSAVLGNMEWISIHALRVEGDWTSIILKGAGAHISIHALRVEGDM